MNTFVVACVLLLVVQIAVADPIKIDRRKRLVEVITDASQIIREPPPPPPPIIDQDKPDIIIPDPIFIEDVVRQKRSYQDPIKIDRKRRSLGEPNKFDRKKRDYGFMRGPRKIYRWRRNSGDKQLT